MRHLLQALALTGTLFVLSGCTLGISLLGAGAGMLADRSVDHILESTVSKSFPISLDETYAATLLSIDQLDLAVYTLDQTEQGLFLTSQASGRSVEIELERVSAYVTRMRVDVKHNYFRRDRATAAAIVDETERLLYAARLANHGTLKKVKLRVPTAEILRSANLPYRVKVDPSAYPPDPAKRPRPEPVRPVVPAVVTYR